MRKCFVLVEKEVKLEDVRKGQLFRLESGDGKDDERADPFHWSIADSDGFIEPKSGVGGVKCSGISFVRNMDNDVRLGIIAGKVEKSYAVKFHSMSVDELSFGVAGGEDKYVVMLDEKPSRVRYATDPTGRIVRMTGKRTAVYLNPCDPSKPYWKDQLDALENITEVHVYSCAARRIAGIVARERFVPEAVNVEGGSP